MLKKIFIGILCFIILAATGGGIYLYTLDWNKHKTVVAQRFSQITGLRANIDGNLNVELFPSPKFTASKVKFFKPSDMRDPLIEINEISALVELLPLKDNKFILSSMNMVRPTIFIKIDKDGKSNWNNVGQNTINKSGNIEVSFSDIKLNNTVIDYVNLAKNTKGTLEGITANISAPSLKGPYKTSGHFIHNKSEIKFNGNIVKDKDLSLKMNLSSVSSSTNMNIEGTFGEKSHGLISFDTKSLWYISNTIFGDNSIQEYYDNPLYASFKYDAEGGIYKLNNFTVKYGKNTAGTGNVVLMNSDKGKSISADFNMGAFDFDIIKNLSKDVIRYKKNNKDINDLMLSKFEIKSALKAEKVLINKVDAQNLSLNFDYNDGIINVNRLGVVMPGNSHYKGAGKIDLSEALEYKFDQSLKTDDLRIFASIFNIDLAKLAPTENKKNIFKKAEIKTLVSGNMDKLKISIPEASFDATVFNGNVGILKKEDKSQRVLAEINSSKIILDQYVQSESKDMKNASFKDKFTYQMNLLPWKDKFTFDANINLTGTVYNEVPMEDVRLQFSSDKDKLIVKNLSINSLAGAKFNLKMTADKIYTHPEFSDLFYDIKTSNFPLLAKTLKIDTGTKELFNRKLFASKGIINGSLSKFTLNSVQKFGDTEFSYNGDVVKDFVSGNIELKANNFAKFIRSIGFDYNPDIPVTTFTFTGKIAGNNEKFKLDNIKAYLGANAVIGNLKFDNSGKKTNFVADLKFNKFDADRWFRLPKTLIKSEKSDNDDFIRQPIFSTKQIDYSPLSKVNFDIKASADLLNLMGTIYTDATIDTKLKDKILTVSKFKTRKEASSYDVKFVLDTLEMPKINGTYTLEKVNSPKLGGKTYSLDSGLLDISGSFNSLVGNQKEFIDNLDANGKFVLSNTAMNGWDFDIIKFEFEQRKTTSGLEKVILDCLKSGRSNFTKIRGSYDINKGSVVAENIIWESPVINMGMKLSLNLTNWLLNADFSAYYHNASFSDILKFYFNGNMVSPVVKVDLTETINRIKVIEDKLNDMRESIQKKKIEKISGKLNKVSTAINSALQDVNRLALDIVRYEPTTDNKDVLSIYESNIIAIREAETAIRDMQMKVKNITNEDDLMNLESKLGAVKAKLKFIPKALEENFIVDAKYIFDDIFNKIAWIYNVSQNNAAYHKSLTDVYMAQVDLLANNDTPITEEQFANLKKGIDDIDAVAKGLTDIHTKIRDGYLNVIDSNKISDMNRNNNLAEMTLKKMLNDTHQLNEKIISNIDLFRAVLGITSRDYDNYLIYPPENIEDIDVTQPTVKNPDGQSVATPKEEVAEEKADVKHEPLQMLEEVKPASPEATSAVKTEDDAVSVTPEATKEPIKEEITKNANEDKKKETLSLINPDNKNGLASFLARFVTKQSDVKAEKVVAKADIKEQTKVAVKETKPEVKAEKVVAKANVKEPTKVAVKETKHEVKAEKVAAKADIKEQTKVAEKEESVLEKTKNKIVNFIGNALSSDTVSSNDTSSVAALNITIDNKEVKSAGNKIETPKVETPEKSEKQQESTLALNNPKLLDLPKVLVEKAEEKSVKMKINPVVAMNIGKNNSNITIPVEKAEFQKKKGFTVKKDPVEDKPEIVAPPIQSGENIIVADTMETIDEPLKEEVVASIEPATENVLPATIQPVKKNMTYEVDLLKIFADADTLNITNQNENDITHEAIIYAETKQNIKPKNNILFPSRKALEFSGNIGKTMFGNKTESPSQNSKNKFVFASTTAPLSNLSGTIGKSATIVIK